MNYSIGKSNIHGNGIIANQVISEDEYIDIAIVDNSVPRILDFTITEKFGKYINHSDSPNADLRKIGKNYYLIANQTIWENEEITSDYDQAPSFIKGKKHFQS